jgi:hypothetical protein
MNILQVLTHRIGSLIGIKNEHLSSSFFIPIKERSCLSKLVRCSFFIPIKENILQVLTHGIGSLIGIKNEHLTSFDTHDRFFNWNEE